MDLRNQVGFLHCQLKQERVLNLELLYRKYGNRNSITGRLIQKEINEVLMTEGIFNSNISS
jgi:hypothetical protein